MGRLRIGTGFALLGWLALTAPADAAAQNRERVRERCLSVFPSPERCSGAALMVEALAGGLGLAFNGASTLPGTPSTIGRRVVGPRWALSGRVGLTDVSFPPSSRVVSKSEEVVLTTAQAELAIGAFDGFSPGPTVGGLLAVDVVGSYGVSLLPGDDGFEGNATGWGYGVRLGIVRESFTLPAVTVTAMRRHLGDVRFEVVRLTPGGAGTERVELDDLTVTSVRATAGKELRALGLLAGIGWDRVRGDGRFSAVSGAMGETSTEAPFTDGGADRVVVFAGLTKTFLVFQLSLEGGFATGYDAEPGLQPLAGDAYDPTGGSLFGSLGFRLIH